MAPGSIPGLRSLGETVVQVTRPLIGDKREPLAELRGAWSEIVGWRLAPICRPARIVMPPRKRIEGTLHLQVASGAVALQLQHQAPLLIQRINACLGYPAVARLKLIHAPFPPPEPALNLLALGDLGERKAAVDVPLDGISSPRLRASLAKLARNLAGSDSPVNPAHDSGPACSDDTRSL